MHGPLVRRSPFPVHRLAVRAHRFTTPWSARITVPRAPVDFAATANAVRPRFPRGRSGTSGTAGHWPAKVWHRQGLPAIGRPKVWHRQGLPAIGRPNCDWASPSSRRGSHCPPTVIQFNARVSCRQGWQGQTGLLCDKLVADSPRILRKPTASHPRTYRRRGAVLFRDCVYVAS